MAIVKTANREHLEKKLIKREFSWFLSLKPRPKLIFIPITDPKTIIIGFMNFRS